MTGKRVIPNLIQKYGSFEFLRIAANIVLTCRIIPDIFCTRKSSSVIRHQSFKHNEQNIGQIDNFYTFNRLQK